MKLLSTSVPFKATKAFSKLFLDYQERNPSLKNFCKNFPEPEAFTHELENTSKGCDRKLLVDVLKEQHNNVSEGSNSLIDSLLNENTFTVCTAHQPCLFTGPLYFIYKIVSAVNLAKALKKQYPKYNFVPVYWMGSEDHDFEEINHLHLFGKKLEWKLGENSGMIAGKSPVGRMHTDSVAQLIQELKPLLGEEENAKELLAMLSSSYLENKTLAEATRTLVYNLFGNDSLLIIDGDNARLKKAFVPIMQDDILNHANEKLVNQTIAELKSLGYQTQLNPRKINVFYIHKNERNRIVSENNNFRTSNTEEVFNADQIKNNLQEHPEKFSPNAVLRPLYQQQVLPNIAYVGGPAETAYWLELKRMFDFHKINYPLLVPRHSVLWVDEKSMVQLKRMGFSLEEIFNDTDTLVKLFIERNSAVSSLGQEELQMRELYDALSAKAAKTDATLKATVEAELQKALQSLKNIEVKIARAEKQKQETSITQIKKLKEKLFPEGKLQERHDNFISLYLKHGKSFLSALEDHLPAFQQPFIILSEQA